jgi:hypothetical protein
MKYLYKESLLILLLVSSIIAFPQVKTGHFNFTGGPTCEIWTIYIGGATLYGMNLEAGDEIAIFDGEIMVGAMELTQVCTPDNQFENVLSAWSMLYTGPGYTPGNVYSFKAWDESSQTEADEPNITLSDPYGGAWMGNVFPDGDGQYSMVELEFYSGLFPIIEYNPTSFTQSVDINGIAQDFLNIYSVGYSSLLWNIEVVYTEDQYNNELKNSWLSVNPINGILDPGESEIVTLDFNAEDLEEGIYNADIVITSNDPDNPVINVPIQMTVGEIQEPHWVFEGGITSEPVWTIYIAIATLNDMDLVAGDEIAIFDSDLLVGHFILDQVCTYDNAFDNKMTAFSMLITQPGYQAGNDFTFKCWDQSEQIESANFMYEFLVCYGHTYTGNVFPSGSGEYSIAVLNFMSPWQPIDLSIGYQFISSSIIPPDPEMTIIMDEVLNDNLDFVRNSAGQMLRKIGTTWVNGIGDWIVEEGYLIKMFAEDSFTIEGELVDPSTPIPVETGYQFVSYFPEAPMDAIQSFESIIGDDLDFIRNSAGQMLHKIGSVWINGIGDCQPTEGYLVKMFAAGEIIYPVPTKLSGKTNIETE